MTKTVPVVSIISTARNWEQRTQRIRNDKRRHKGWRLFRDRFARSVLLGGL